MGVYESRGQLTRAIKDLLGHWADAKMNWQDPRSAELEKSCLQPLEMDTRNAASALDHVATILHQARRDCE